MDLSEHSEFKNGTLRFFYNESAKDWDKQLALARQRHGLTEGSPYNSIGFAHNPEAGGFDVTQERGPE